jgi:hypothetical protein
MPADISVETINVGQASDPPVGHLPNAAPNGETGGFTIGRWEIYPPMVVSKCCLWVLLALVFAIVWPLHAAKLSDPQVDAYNLRVGTQTFDGLYHFTTNTLLVETAQAIRAMGSDTIKLYLGSNYPRRYHYSLAPSVTSLLTLAANDPSCRQVLDMPFRHIIAWAYPFSNPEAPFLNADYTAAQQANDYREMYDLTCYLLTNYNNSGKTFYLGHWEGDGYLNVNNWSTNPSPVVVSNMVTWEIIRQKGVDDAKNAITSTNVNVFYYAEVNRVYDAIHNGPTNNVRAINYVIPYVTNLDFVSYSSYDAMNYDSATLYSILDYIEARIPTAKAAVLPLERLWIGEYGWGGYTTDAQEAYTRTYIQHLLNYGRKAMLFILFWEIYNNETNKLFCLIDSNNVHTACYHLHQYFYNSARLAVARFKETNGRQPKDSEFVALVSPELNQPLRAPVALTVSNTDPAVLLSASSAQISGTLTQGVYGDDCATVWLFYGRTDGGTVRDAWEQSQRLGINTNFNPTTFSAVLTNFAIGTSYSYRFYATNTSGEAWAPATSAFATSMLDPAEFSSRMKLTFTGYNRPETLNNFPVLVNLGTNLPGFSYRQFALPVGGDLRFADAGGVHSIPYEIDEWNTNGVSSVWVSVPQLSGSNDAVWAYWGNPLFTNLPASSTNGAVWKPDFFAVYHLKESGFPFRDSTQQHPASSGVAPSSAVGKIGHGCAFTGSQYLDVGPINLGDAFTLSAWVNIAPTAFDIQTIWANQKGGYGSPGFAWFVNTFQTNDQRVDFASGDGTNGNEATTPKGTVSFGQWHLLSASVNRAGGNVEFFVDGADLQSGYVVPGFANAADVNLGRFTNASFYFHGVMDEPRIAAGARSSNWVWASWMTVASNAAFATVAPVTQQMPVLSIAQASNGFSLIWPTPGVGFALYTTTNLVASASWTLTTNQPRLVSTQWQVTLPPGASHDQFYRLQSQ